MKDGEPIILTGQLRPGDSSPGCIIQLWLHEDGTARVILRSPYEDAAQDIVGSAVIAAGELYKWLEGHADY